MPRNPVKMQDKMKNAIKPERRLGDALHTIIRTGISAVPLVGGPAVELFNTVISPPLNKRRDEWLESIADELNRIEEKVEGLRFESLQIMTSLYPECGTRRK